EPRDGEHHAPAEDRAGLLDAALGEAAAARDLLGLDAIVEVGPELLVREPVELGAHLAKLGEDRLLVAALLVAPVRARGALQVEHKASPRRHRDGAVEHLAELVHLAVANEPGGRE